MKGDYSNGRIYKIEPIIEHEKHEVYYGSRTSLLCKRMDLHRSGYKRWKSGKRKKTMVYDLFDAYGVENCKIYLVQNFPCKNREELRAKEGEYIRNNVCVNKNVAGRTAKELRDKNKVQKSIYDKEFFKLNKSKIVEYHKQYLKVKVSCICGVNHMRVSKSRHSKRNTGNTTEKQQFRPFGNPNRSPKHSHGSQAIIGPSPPASSQATARSPEVNKQKKTMEKTAANTNPSPNPKRKMMEFTPDTCPPSPTAPPSISRTRNAREIEKNFHSVLSVPHRYTPNHGSDHKWKDVKNYIVPRKCVRVTASKEEKII
jgi:hypothetical protein